MIGRLVLVWWKGPHSSGRAGLGLGVGLRSHLIGDWRFLFCGRADHGLLSHLVGDVAVVHVTLLPITPQSVTVAINKHVGGVG